MSSKLMNFAGDSTNQEGDNSFVGESSSSPTQSARNESSPLCDGPDVGPADTIRDTYIGLGSLSEMGPQPSPQRTLRTFTGVFTPVALSMFSTVLFLRLGFVVGQSGIVLALVQFALAYFILYMTILSICAISTNGAIEGGGAYYMISRALGPEFGGSIGFLFFLANVFSCALYVSGFVEGLTDNFGTTDNHKGLPVGANGWWNYLYATAVLALCLFICIIGAAMFARTSVAILAIVVICTIMVMISMFVKLDPICVSLPAANNNSVIKPNTTLGTNFCIAPGDKNNDTKGANYTSMMSSTFKDNLWSHYQYDYQTGKVMNFFTVFAVLFSSVTGIMNGANMSGELKDPSKAIPKGTLLATLFTFSTYIIMALLTASTSSRELLINNYNYLKQVNIWGPFVIIGLFSATLSAALGNLIGASRVLEALAKDQLFWWLFKPATITTKSGNPYVAVLMSWILVQLILLVGSLNALAPMTSIFFLLSYATTNLACLALELASAPNFRPTFNFFSWHTSTFGLIGCMVMCFFIDPMYASVALVLFIALIVGLLFFRTFPQSWGSISQALIFHQVRKYLLMLDSRKEHVKFWRPQMLLMVANPRTSCEIIDFVNDVKKGGLYVIGHVKIGDMDNEHQDPCISEYPQWLTLVDELKIKAFVELTLASSVREGMNQLIRLSGLGGMKPNTVCMGFYDDTLPEDSLVKRKKPRKRRFYGAAQSESEDFSDICEFPSPRKSLEEKMVDRQEYIAMILDAFKLKKNVCLLRHFNKLDKEGILKSPTNKFIDVWPVNFFRPDTANFYDNTCLFVLQLACILNMVPKWRSKTILRIFMCVEEETEEVMQKKDKLAKLLRQLRIIGPIQIVQWGHATALIRKPSEGNSQYFAPFPLPDDYLRSINELVLKNCDNTAVTFLYLPKVRGDEEYQELYLKHLETITEGLPPTVLVNGIHPVTSTTL